MKMLDTNESRLPLRGRLLESERLMQETDCYNGVIDLALRHADPLKFETLHTRLRASCVSAREMARRISASPGVREVGEMVVAIYTPEGDAVALSNGIMVHVHTMSRFIKWMIREGYEANPGIRDSDIFANNDAFIGTVQVPDVMDVIPIYWESELVGWAGAVCHELESGGITPGGDVCLAQERFTEGLFVCAEKIGEYDEIRRDDVIRCERNLPMPIYWVLDEKAKAASCIEMREAVRAIIGDVGLGYWKGVMKEFIEEGRRGQLARTRQLTVPGIYRGHTFYGHVTAGKPGFQPLGPPNWLYNIPLEMEVKRDGTITLDFEGTQPWGYHSINCTPAGMDGGMFVTLIQHMNFEGLVNDGAWMAAELKLPRGTWTNPGNEMVATATSWALLLPAYVGWNPESDMGNIEIWEQNMPMVYIGRSILPNSGGSGKCRGGCSFISTWLINKTNHLRLVTSEHSSRVFDNAGMCGGYPAPTCQMHRVVRNPNLAELIKKRKPLPHGIGLDPAHSDLEKLVTGRHETSEGPYITKPHKSGDIFTHAYNGGGGFGDVLERDPIKTASDVENGYLTRQAALQVYGIVLRENEEDRLKADLAATAKKRKTKRARRLRTSVPVAQWMKVEKRKVAAAQFTTEVKRMYASAMTLSPRFTKDFTSFWGLKPGFKFVVGDDE